MLSRVTASGHMAGGKGEKTGAGANDGGEARGGGDGDEASGGTAAGGTADGGDEPQYDASHVVMSLHSAVTADVSAAHVVDEVMALVLSDGQYVVTDER